MRGRRPYVVPEGGSNGLGSLGYVDCMREVRAQMRHGLAGGDRPFDVVVHACGSGGTAAGVALGAARWGTAKAVRAMAVCDDRAYFDRTIARIVGEARAWDAALGEPAPLVVDAGSPSVQALWTLEIVQPSADELALHGEYLAALDRESKGRCVWLRLEGAEEAAA